jgi:hypothetical protein
MTTRAVPFGGRTAAVSRPAAGAYPASSPAFDWTMGALSALLAGGLIQDGWAHSHGQVDQSFFTWWHAILYSSMALNGIVLGATAVRNARRGYAARRALPFGYTLALGGVILFALGGGADLAWHEIFGIETGIDALLSPSHLLLAFSTALIFSGPIRSIAAQYGPDQGGWKHVGPVVPALLATLTLLGFFLAYAQPIEDGFTTQSVQQAAGTGASAARLFSISGRDGALRRLAVPAGLDIYGVTLAPDGRIAYRAQEARATDLGGLRQSSIYVTKPDGSAPKQITHAKTHDTQPAFSPDGKQIAYVAMPAGTSGNFQLNVVSTDGTTNRTIVDDGVTLETPTWSPDGKQIAFASRNGTTQMIAVVDVATGKRRWLQFTGGGSTPLWTTSGLIYASDDGSLRQVALDGTNAKTLIAHASNPSASPNGKYLAYVANDNGSAQAFVANADGKGGRNATAMPGLDVQHPAVDNDGSVVLTAAGKPPVEHTFAGFSLATSALLLQAVTIAGILLLPMRRWRVPPGTFTIVLTLFALAMATQSDYYYDAIPALCTGVAADIAVIIMGKRLSAGTPFYTFAFALTAILTASYLLASTMAAGATAWNPNMLIGVPILAGCAGLLVAFCYNPPLPEPTA